MPTIPTRGGGSVGWAWWASAGRPTGKDGPTPRTLDALPDAVLTPAPTLPADIVVAETEPETDDTRYRRPGTTTAPLVLGPDVLPPTPPQDHR